MAQITIDKHTGISLTLALGILGLVYVAAEWKGKMEERMQSAENQNAKQWQRMSKIEDINAAQLRIEGKVDAITKWMKPNE